MNANKQIAVIAGPSGSGKNTLIRELIRSHPGADVLVTATTRTPRAGEVEGKDYFFFSQERFDEELMAGNIAGERFAPLFGGTHYGIYLPDLRKKFERDVRCNNDIPHARVGRGLSAAHSRAQS
jgi:guanylate kinase